MTELQAIYNSVLLTVIALTLLVLLFFCVCLYFSDKTKNNSSKTESSYQKTMEDLDRLIQRKCAVSYRRALEPYVNKALKNKPLINDKVVNEISVIITKDILTEMSDEYRNKLEHIYNAEILNDIILELVYNTVTEMAMSINKTSIKKMNFTRSIGSITKNDLD